MFDARSGALLWTWQAPSDDFRHISNNAPGITFVDHDQYVAIENRVGACLIRADDASPVTWNGPVPKEWMTNRNMTPRSSVCCPTSPDGKRCITHDENGWVVEDKITKQKIMSLPGGEGARGSAFSADNTRIATADYYNGVSIYDAEDGRSLARFPRCLMARYVEFSDDGDTLVVTGHKFQVWICERRRPEYRWGIVCIPELWLTVVLGIAFVSSIWRDQQLVLRRRS